MIAKPCFIHSYMSATVPMHMAILQRRAISVRLGAAVWLLEIQESCRSQSTDAIPWWDLILQPGFADLEAMQP